MASDEWTDQQNDAIVADCFAMLPDDEAVRPYSMVEHNIRALGRAGEERIVLHERSSLAAAGLDDLAQRLRWVSDQDGDGNGYDIASFEADGRPA